MELETYIKQDINAGMLFTVTNDGNGTPYMFIEPIAVDEDDMTPCKIIDLTKGTVVARSTSWGLALERLGYSKNQITLEGNIKTPFGVEY